MSDLAATNCGCNNGNGCSTIFWIICLMCLCNGGNGFGLFNNNGCGDDNNSCIWIILLLLLCNNGCGGF